MFSILNAINNFLRLLKVSTTLSLDYGCAYTNDHIIISVK
jgi:hypothetical protein